jgi:polyhydroxybutyrate depolymerase
VYAQYDSIFVGNEYRYYLQHFPPTYNTATPSALVLALHGGLGSGPQLETQSGLSAKADQENFVVVYPEGVVGNFGIRTWNAGGCCGYAMNNNVDDVGFIDKLLDTLINNFSIDTTRIFVTGMSNGGFMSYRLACELSHRIAAIAPVAASMIFNCLPANPVSIIHFHSYLDDNIPFDGGIGNGLSIHYNPPLDSVFGVWANFNSCSIMADTVYDGADFDKVTWTGCNCNSAIEYYITHDGGHSWPGGNSTAIGDPVSQYLSANDLMWDFFQQHPLCMTTSINQANISKPKIEVYPNPAQNRISVSSKGNPINRIVIQNIMGEVLIAKDFPGSSTIGIDLKELESGFFLIQIILSAEKISKKMIVSK